MSEALENEVELSTFGQFYRALHEKDAKAQIVNYLQNVFLSKIAIEPVTGEPIITALSHIVTSTKLQSQDKFSHLLSYCDTPLKTVINHPRYKIIREHGLVPIYKAQQLDSRSVQWLSRQPGNNIRQKLAANPHVLALMRRNSFDTLENRFVHNVIKYLDYLLVIKRKTVGLNNVQDWLAQELDLWCSKEEIKEIKAWEAMPPNNVLLEDTSYQKIWRAGNKLNKLDDEISNIYNNLEVSFSHRLWLEIISQMQSIDNVHLIERMLLPDVSNLTYKNDYGDIDVEENQFKTKGTYRLDETKLIDISVSFNVQKSKIVLVANFDEKKVYTINLSDLEVTVSDGNEQEILTYSMLNNNPRDMADKIVQSWIGKSNQPREFKALESNTFATIDLSSSTPYVRCNLTPSEVKPSGNESQIEGYLPLRLLSQRNNDTGKQLDLSLATAIDLDDNSQLLTSDSIYDEDNAYLIVDIISKSLKSPKVHYLLSDYISDFDSKVIRSEFNRIYHRATPLPKSVAAVFALQAKALVSINKGELFVVLEHGKDGLYATPVIAREREGEFYWERHPSFKLNDIGTNTLVHQALSDIHPKAVVDALCSVFSYSELIENNRKPAIKYNNTWFTLNKIHSNNISQQQVELTKSDLVNVLNNNSVNYNNSLNIIVLDPSIKVDGFQPKELHEKLDITLGSKKLFDLMSFNENGVYWRDHLPKLLTRLPKDGKEVELVFVGDKTTIEPKRGKRVSLNISNNFTIPAGKCKITLPIFQGQGKDIKRFSLTLEHSAFPLKNDVHCKLDLGYTYGDEEPYQLIFRPIGDDAPFNQVLAKWAKWSMTQEQKRVCPLYPQVKSVHELTRLSSQGKNDTDILEWSERVFNNIHDYHSFFVTGESIKRISIEVDYDNYFEDKNGNKCQKIYLEQGEVFIHQAQFEGSLFDNNPSTISGDLVKNDRGGYKLQGITEFGAIPKIELDRISGKWRFPILTLLDQERSLLDDDFPKELKENAYLALKEAVELLDYNIPKKLDLELRQFISYFHSDIPTVIANQWVEGSKLRNKLPQLKTYIAYALGDCSTSWQKTLLDNIILPINDTGETRAVSLEILGTAVWRSKSLIHQLTKKQIDSLVNRLSDFLINDELNTKFTNKPYRLNSLLRRLELAFSLIRLRTCENKSIACSMEVGSDNSDKLLHAIQLLNKKLGGKLFKVLQPDSKVQCRVHLGNISKPDSFNKTPDILYALNMYLSGDDGANCITISEITSG